MNIIAALNTVINTLNIIPVMGEANIDHMSGSIKLLKQSVEYLTTPAPVPKEAEPETPSDNPVPET